MAKYIDASLAKEMAMAKANTAKSDFERTLMTALAAFMDAFPPADVVPVRHGEWASTKDKLPEPGVEVIVCTMEDGEVDMEIGYWYDRGGIVRWVFPSGNRPVHYWMPLPEMPKVDGGANNG